MDYTPLTSETLPARLCSLPALTDRIGPARSWTVAEVGDGNLNLVFIVSGPLGRIIVKQALPYVRLVGDSWPLPLNRAFFEYNALTRHAARDPGRVPEVFHFDEGQALIVMRCLSPHVILRKSVVQEVMHPMLARHMGVFLARSLFRGSALSLSGRALRQDMARLTVVELVSAVVERSLLLLARHPLRAADALQLDAVGRGLARQYAALREVHRAIARPA